MSQWKVEFDGFKLGERVQKCVTTLEAASVEGLSPVDLANYGRLLKVLRVIHSRVTHLDPELYSRNTWGNFPNLINEAQSQISNFAANHNAAHLTQANNSTDNILGVLRPGDGPTSENEVSAIADATRAFQDKLVEEFQRVKTRGEAITAQFSTLSNDFANVKAKLDEAVRTIDLQKGRLDQSIATFQKQFSDAEATRTKDFAAEVKKRVDDFNAQANKIETEFAEKEKLRKGEYEKFFESARKESDDHLKFLDRRQDEVNKIFGAIGTAAFAGNFKNTADTEAKAANLFRWVSIGLMGAMVAVAVTTFVYSLTHELDWKIFAFRLATSVILLIPAVYSAQESAKHRLREEHNRKVHLELASLDAYLALLPEPQRNELKGKLTEKFFGRDEPVGKEEKISKHALFDLVSPTVKNLTKSK